MNRLKQNVWLRVLLSIAAGLILALVISEVTYRMSPDGTDRPPRRVELVIPAGTAGLVAQGQTPPGIPESMVFVQGDTLVVVNQDSTSHQLGPIWVPPNSTGSLVLDQAEQFSYECSFQPDRFLGLDVRTQADLSSRIQAMVVLGLPMGGLLAVYSFLLQINQPGNDPEKSGTG
jgi:hypothetical protein